MDSHVSNPLNCDNQFRIYRVLSLTVVSSPSLPLLPLLAAGVARSALADIHVAAVRMLQPDAPLLLPACYCLPEGVARSALADIHVTGCDPAATA